MATETRRDLFLLLMIVLVLVIDVNLSLYLPITSTSMSTITKGDCETLKMSSAKAMGADHSRTRMNKPKIVVIMPAYNASKTLEQTVRDIPRDCIHECFVVDDFSADSTVAVARRLGLRVFLHGENQGYGGNQKTCYVEALKTEAEIVVMLHPDYQYDPKKIPDLVRPIVEDRADIVLGSRMAYAVAGGMPLYKRISNRFLTWCENKVFGLDLSEYHTGFRAFRRSFLETVPFLLNSNDFIFDQEIVAQAVWFEARIAEISVPHRYFPEASTIGLGRSVRYGLGVLKLLVTFLLNRRAVIASPRYRPMHHAYAEIPIHSAP